MLDKRYWGEIGLVIVWIATSLSAGFIYSPYRDDWVVLGRPATLPYGTRWGFLIAHADYGYRPVSFLVDIEVWSRFWPNLTIPWAIIMALMLVAVLLGRRLVERVSGHGFWVGAAIILLFPAVVEGQYWIAASCGIVLSLLFLVLGAWAAYYALNSTRGTGTLWWWILAGMAFLLSDASYEQVWLPSLAILVALAWRYRTSLIRTLAPGAAALGVTGGWYLAQTAALHLNGKSGVRNLSELRHEMANVDPQFASLWFHTVWHAFGQALTAPAMSGWWWLTIGIGTLLVVAAVITARGRAVGEGERPVPDPTAPVSFWALGVAWFVLSLVPWYLTTYGWVSARAATTTVVGVAFIVEGLVLFAGVAGPWAVRILGALLAAIMLLLGSSLRAQDIAAYRATARLDQALFSTTLTTLHAHGIRGGSLVSNVVPYTWVPWDYYFGNHIEGSFHAGWTIQFGLEDLTDGREHFTVVNANAGPPAFAVTPGAVGVVVNTASPSPNALASTRTSEGLVIQVSLAHHDPHIVRAVWYGPTRT